MKKNIGFGKFIFLFFVFNLFSSCTNLLDELLGTTYDDGTIKVPQVENKKTYKSFENIKEPVVINFPIYDDALNQKGNIMVIVNGEKEEVHDWVYVPDTVSVWDMTAFCVSAGGKNCFVTQGDRYTSFALMDPSKTEVTIYPKTKADNNLYSFGLFDTKPSYLPFENTVVVNDENIEFAPYRYFNSFDCSTGKVTKSVSVVQEEYSKLSPDYDGKSFFYVKSLFGYHQIVQYNPATNTITDLPYCVNLNPLLPGEPFSTFDPKTFKVEENPLLLMHDYYEMNVPYADSKYIVLLSKLIIRMDEEATGPSDYLYIFDRTNPSNPNPVVSIILDDYYTEDESCTFLNEGFELNGKYYIFAEKQTLENDFSVFSKKLYEIDIANKKLIATDLEFREEYYLDFIRYGSKLYFITEDSSSTVYINSYDFSTKKYGNTVSISRESLNLQPAQ